MEYSGNPVVEATEELESFKIDLLKKEDKKGSLIPLLQSAQETYGCQVVVKYQEEN